MIYYNRVLRDGEQHSRFINISWAEASLCYSVKSPSALLAYQRDVFYRKLFLTCGKLDGSFAANRGSASGSFCTSMFLVEIRQHLSHASDEIF